MVPYHSWIQPLDSVVGTTVGWSNSWIQLWYSTTVIPQLCPILWYIIYYSVDIVVHSICTKLFFCKYQKTRPIIVGGWGAEHFFLGFSARKCWLQMDHFLSASSFFCCCCSSSSEVLSQINPNVAINLLRSAAHPSRVPQKSNVVETREEISILNALTTPHLMLPQKQIKQVN